MKRLLFIIALLLTPFAGAAVINVNSSMSEATIQGLINGGSSGDTVFFAGGTYNLASNGGNPNSAALVLKAGLLYTGPSPASSPAHLVGTGLYPLMYFSGTSLSLKYITFDNGLLFLEDGTTSAIINNNIFENMPVCNTTASQTTALFINGGINSSDISYNTFSHIGDNCNNIPNDAQGAGAIGLFAFHNLTITHNTFDNVHEGIDAPISSGGSYDCAGGVFSYNTFTNVTRMGIELLGSSTKPSGLVVAFNNFSLPLNPYFPSFGYSLTAGQNMVFHDNVSNSNSATSGPYGVEIAGVGTQAYNNIVAGKWSVGFSIGNTGGPISITGNKICGPTMNSAPGSGSTPVTGNADGFISWQGSSAGGTFTGNTTSSSATCATGTVTVSANTPPYGWTVMPGAIRTIPVFISGSGATSKKVIWSATGATLSCTVNCAPVVTATITAPAGTCNVTGSVGSYVLTATSNAMLTATSVDDLSMSVTIPLHVCDTSGSQLVDVEPSYNQAYKTQQKILQSYVIGYTDQSVMWAITSQPAGGDGVLVDTVNRDTLFSATVTGRYTITATSVVNGALSGSAIIYVSPNALPAYPATHGRTPNKTEPQECYVDPALTGTDYEIGPSQAITDPTTINFQTWPAGSIARFHNEDTTGLSPTTWAFSAVVRNNGTPTQPLYICGIPDSLGNLPVQDGNLAHENAASAGLGLNGLGGWKMTGTTSGFSQGYALGSPGPDYLNIVGLRIQNFDIGSSYYPPGSSTLTPYTTSSPPSCIWVATTTHFHMEGLDLNTCGWGVLINSNTSGGGRRFTQFHQFIGSHINNFSYPGSFSTHGLYMEGLHSLVDGNLIENPQATLTGTTPNYDNGDYIKMRGGDSIIRNNLFRGLLTNHIIEYPDMEDTWQFVSLDGNLGLAGGTCGNSVWCSFPSNNITIGQLTENAEALANDYAYDNVMANQTQIVAVQDGSQSAPLECSPCSNMADRNGRYYFWNNTVSQAGQALSTINYNGSGFIATNPIFSQISAFVANNNFWSDASTYSGACAGLPCHPFTVNTDGTFVGTFLTNMYPSTVMNLATPINGGTGTGFGNFVNAISWPLAVPLETHNFGLTGANFLTTTPQPMNGATFAPIPSSPLLGAGTANPMAGMPCRFQPDAEWGFVTARTDNCTTIGAIQTGSQPTATGITLSPASAVYPVPPPTTVQTYIATLSWSDGITQQVQKAACGWNSSHGASMQFFGTCSSVGQVFSGAVAGSGNVGATYLGFSPTTPFTVGSGPATVADPTCTPPGGTYGSTQTVTCSTATSGAIVCGTIDGSTPTATTPGTCSNGSSGPFTVSSSLTIKVLGTKAGDVNSNVVSVPYVIGSGTVANPTFSPVAGSYVGTQSVTISTTTGGATICYTTNGATPGAATPGTCDVGSTTYSGAVTVASSLTIKALGTLAANTNSSVVSAAYTIIPPTVATPTFSPVAGAYPATQNVTISTVTGGATICYTTDGTTPTAVTAGTCSHGTTYSTAVSVATSLTIKAIGTLSGDTNSSVGSAAYTIVPAGPNLKMFGGENMRGGIVRQ